MSINEDKKSNNEDNIFIAETSEEEKQAIRLMTGNKKIWNYFLHLLRDKSFQDSIISIKKYNLDENDKPKNINNLRKVINTLCRNFGLDEVMWSEVLENYILKNKIPEENLNSPCLILDRVDIGENEYPDGEYEDDPDDMPKKPKELNSWSYSYPVIIRVSQYASEREILDCIKKSYTREIKPIQEKYKDEEIRLGKIRKKKQGVQERNDFIYENRHLSRKKIMHLVGDKFGKNAVIDYGYIGKIISLEEKKRK